MEKFCPAPPPSPIDDGEGGKGGLNYDVGLHYA